MTYDQDRAGKARRRLGEARGTSDAHASFEGVIREDAFSECDSREQLLRFGKGARGNDSKGLRAVGVLEHRGLSG